MTWFRCGGGSGMPADLKNRMNAVFNKKFGTAVDYPPEGWPDDVNLMGPLPEKTIVSSPIADFSDGADDVPTKSLVVTIPPTLSGVSSVTETQTGRNLLLPYNADSAEITVNGIKRSYSLDNQEFTFEGTNTKTDTSWLIFSINASDFELNGLKTGVTYRFSHNFTADMYAQFTYNKSGGGIGAMGYLRGNAGQNASVSFTLPSDFSSLRQFQIGVSNTARAINITAHFQIEFGSTAHAYEPYTTQTTYTANLGRTIYGGTADIVTGEGQELVKKITVSSFTGTWGAVTNGNAYYISVADTTHSTSVVNPIMMQANQLFTYGSVGRNSAPTWQYGGNDGGPTVHTFILPSEYDTLTKANNFLASLQTPLEVTLTLATPTDFTFDGQEINSLYGYNAFWSDQGDTEVTYRADINLALQALSGSRGLMMARPAIEPANGDQGSEESTENNIETEGEEDAR